MGKKLEKKRNRSGKGIQKKDGGGNGGNQKGGKGR